MWPVGRLTVGTDQCGCRGVWQPTAECNARGTSCTECPRLFCRAAVSLHNAHNDRLFNLDASGDMMHWHTSAH